MNTLMDIEVLLCCSGGYRDYHTGEVVKYHLMSQEQCVYEQFMNNVFMNTMGGTVRLR